MSVTRSGYHECVHCTGFSLGMRLLCRINVRFTWPLVQHFLEIVQVVQTQVVAGRASLDEVAAKCLVQVLVLPALFWCMWEGGKCPESREELHARGGTMRSFP